MQEAECKLLAEIFSVYSEIYLVRNTKYTDTFD